MEDLNQWQTFVETFRLPVSMSLIGALIGHFKKNGVIQMPYIVLSYEKGPLFQNPTNTWQKWLRVVYLTYDFLRYFVGIRYNKRPNEKAVYIDLGFLGDLLVGIGTGIAAKTVVAATNTTNPYAIISASLVAGIAGMSYFQKWQTKSEDSWLEKHAPDLETLFEPEPEVPAKRIKVPAKPRRLTSVAKQELQETQQQVAASEEEKE